MVRRTLCWLGLSWAGLDVGQTNAFDVTANNGTRRREFVALVTPCPASSLFHVLRTSGGSTCRPTSTCIGHNAFAEPCVYELGSCGQLLRGFSCCVDGPAIVAFGAPLVDGAGGVGTACL